MVSVAFRDLRSGLQIELTLWMASCFSHERPVAHGSIAPRLIRRENLLDESEEAIVAYRSAAPSVSGRDCQQTNTSVGAAVNGQSVAAVRGLVFGTIGTGVAALGIGIWQAHGDVYEKATRDLSLESQIAREHAEKLIDTYRLAVERIIDVVGNSSDQEIVAAEAQLHAQVKDIVQKLPQTQSAYVVDRHGAPLVSATAMPVPKEARVAADRDFFLQLADLSHPDVHVSRLYIGRIDGKPFFAVSKRRPLLDGQFNGLVNVSAEPEYIAQFYKTIAMQSGDTLSLIRSDGAFLVRLPFTGEQLINTRARMLPSHASGLPVEGRYRGVSGRDDAERIYEFRKLRGYPIYAVAGRTVAAIDAAWLHAVTRLLSWGLPAILLLGGFGWFALRRVQQEQEARALALSEMSKRVKAEEALHHSERMEAIGRLTAVLAHDFRNVLAVIASMVHLLERRAPDHATLLDGGRRAIEQGRSLVDRLLAFSRRQELKIEPTDLNRLINGMQQMLQISAKEAGKSVSLKFVLEPDLWLALADAGQFETALLNLASNARDAMPEGGDLTIRTANGTLDGGSGAAECVEVRVSDTGTGIPPDHVARIFEPFFTTKAPGKGTGLGLSSVYGYVQQCGGKLQIESSVGHGTTVTMQFLKAQQNIEAPRQSAEIVAFPSSGSVLPEQAG